MSEARLDILNRIRAARAQAYLPGLDATAPRPRAPVSGEPLADLFARAVAAAHGVCRRLKDDAQAQAWVVAELHGRGARQVLCWAPDQLPVPGMAAALAAAGIELVASRLDGRDRQADLARLGQIEIGLTGARAGLAHTGSLVLLSSQAAGRMASLLPEVHIALVRVEQLYPDLLTWSAASGVADAVAASSNTVIITGPSRSADIGQTLTLGAHGPREWVVGLVG